MSRIDLLTMQLLVATCIVHVHDVCLQELTDAIFAVTNMDPNMSVQKIEIHTGSEEV